jgi:hypothetical protein
VEVDIGEYRACDAALGCSRKAVPLGSTKIQVSCTKEFPDEVDKALIFNLLAEQVD